MSIMSLRFFYTALAIMLLFILPVKLAWSNICDHCGPPSGWVSADIVAGSGRCSGDDCGAVLNKNGWSTTHSCHDGHQWSYILQKQGAVKYCQGVNGRGGPVETPCQDFSGDLNAFRELAAQADAQTIAYTQAKRDVRLDAYLLEKLKHKVDTQVSCVLTSQQINPYGGAR